MSRRDPRAEALAELRSALPLRGRARRRVVAELEQHLEDCVSELHAEGVGEADAIAEALSRLGEPEVIASEFRALRGDRGLSWRRVAAVPTAWAAVAAMSLVTLLAAELPQASGAKAPTAVPPTPAAPAHYLARRHSASSRRP